MIILIAHSKDDHAIHDGCKRMIARDSLHWRFDQYVVDEADSSEPDDNAKAKLKNADYFVLIHTRGVRGNFFDHAAAVKALLKPGCEAVAYRQEGVKRPVDFDDFTHKEGVFELSEYFLEQHGKHSEHLHRQSKTDKISDLFKSRLSVDGIIYLSYFYYSTQRHREDLLDSCMSIGDNYPPSDRLSAFMKAKQFTPMELRRVYDQLFETFLLREAEVERLLNAAQQGDLVRVVLDVRTGAFYLNEVEGSHYVCGVTINQYAVYHLEQVMYDLCDQVNQIESGRS
jgi:hypothetical protein